MEIADAQTENVTRTRQTAAGKAFLDLPVAPRSRARRHGFACIFQSWQEDLCLLPERSSWRRHCEHVLQSAARRQRATHRFQSTEVLYAGVHRATRMGCA